MIKVDLIIEEKSNFEIFQSTLYMKSGSMPLIFHN